MIDKAKGPLTPAAAALFQGITNEASFYKVIGCFTISVILISSIITCLEFVREYLMKRIVKVQQMIDKAKVLWNGDYQYQVTGPFNDQCVDRAGNKSDVGTPESWVHACYWLVTWKKVYSYKINPLNGKDLWKKHPCPNTLIPPKVHPQIGRPPKKRKKSADELSSQKISRAGKTVTCDT
ncbi:hypothetical protein Tco_1251457, partial [Tanacetum coccineum]